MFSDKSDSVIKDLYHRELDVNFFLIYVFYFLVFSSRLFKSDSDLCSIEFELYFELNLYMSRS